MTPSELRTAALDALGLDPSAPHPEHAGLIDAAIKGIQWALTRRRGSHDDALEVLRRTWQPFTQSNVDLMSEEDIASEIASDIDSAPSPRPRARAGRPFQAVLAELTPAERAEHDAAVGRMIKDFEQTYSPLSAGDTVPPG